MQACFEILLYLFFKDEKRFIYAIESTFNVIIKTLIRNEARKCIKLTEVFNHTSFRELLLTSSDVTELLSVSLQYSINSYLIFYFGALK